MKLTINLSTRTYLNRRALFGWYGFIGFCLLVLLGFYFWSVYLGYSQKRILESRLGEISQKIEELKTTDVDYSVAKAKALEQKIQQANGLLLRDSFRWTTLLGRLEEVVPEGAGVQSITPDFKDKSLRLVGLTRDVATLRSFIDSLLASTYFSDVYLLTQDQLIPQGESSDALIRYTVLLKGAF